MSKIYEGDELVEKYEAFRPTYPVAVATEVLKFLDEQNPGEKRRGLMLDVGCGGGQATRLFSPHFEKVLGIDVSTSQINMAKKTVPSVEFQIGSASNLPVDSGSVDLIIVGMAAHYFDLNSFLSECDRALRPGGCVAIFGYWPCRLNTLQGDIIEGSTGDFGISGILARYDEAIGVSTYVINTLMQRYQPIYDRINKSCKRLVKGIELNKYSSVDEYVSFLETIGEYCLNKETFGDTDPLMTAKNEIKALLGLTDNVRAMETFFEITFEYPIVLFRK